MKKFLTFLIAITMLFSMTSVAFAADISQNTSIDDFSIELSIFDLQEGVTIAIERDGNGNIVARQISEQEILNSENSRVSRAEVLATFHTGITFNKNTSKGYLHWNATGQQLTRVTAKVYCKDTSILFPTSYFNDDIDGYSDLSGRYNLASGATDDFSIPSGVTKVKVGWSNAYVTTLVDGKMSMASASQTVTIR